MLLGTWFLAMFLVGLPVALNLRGVTDKLFERLVRSQPTSTQAKPWNLRIVGWAAVVLAVPGMVDGFSGAVSSS